jgi:hypothetical protein
MHERLFPLAVALGFGLLFPWPTSLHASGLPGLLGQATTRATTTTAGSKQGGAQPPTTEPKAKEPNRDLTNLFGELKDWEFWAVLFVAFVFGLLGSLAYELFRAQGPPVPAAPGTPNPAPAPMPPPNKNPAPAPGPAVAPNPAPVPAAPAVPNPAPSKGVPKTSLQPLNWDLFSRVFLGGMAAIAVLYLVTPDGLIKLVSLSILAGSMGSTLFVTLQDRVKKATEVAHLTSTLNNTRTVFQSIAQKTQESIELATEQSVIKTSPVREQLKAIHDQATNGVRIIEAATTPQK